MSAIFFIKLKESDSTTYALQNNAANKGLFPYNIFCFNFPFKLYRDICCIFFL